MGALFCVFLEEAVSPLSTTVPSKTAPFHDWSLPPRQSLGFHEALWSRFPDVPKSRSCRQGPIPSAALLPCPSATLPTASLWDRTTWC